MMIYGIRARTLKFSYKKIVRPVLFLFDPELMHRVFIKIGSFIGSNPITKWFTNIAFNYQDSILQQNILGLKFINPVGLAAGFDKNGQMVSAMEDVGFGFVEIGSMTASPCAGNPGKRFERLIKENSLWVHFGLNNLGASMNYNRIKDQKFRIPVGVSVAKTNSKETIDPEAGLKDYLFTINTFKNKADFFVLNISCPNAFGGCTFAEPKLFDSLAKDVGALNVKQPIFVKLSPDLSKQNLDKIIAIAAKYNISGFICTNLTKEHNIDQGGISGKLLEKKADSVLSYVYKKAKQTKHKFTIIGTGGVFNAEDAYKKIKLGANLVQLVTSLIYEGPQVVGHINRDLVKLLKRDGYRNISEAVGKDAK
jgi:dihydroorotate dehydrogenase